jgi:hypothetical protein
MSFDQPHRIKVHASVLTDKKHRHNVRVIERRRGVRLQMKALQAGRVEHRSERQDPERDAPAKRDLLRFVNHSHAAASPFAQQAKVAQLPEARFKDRPKRKKRMPKFIEQPKIILAANMQDA